MNAFDQFFERLTGYARHDWQSRLAVDDVCRDRLIRIPTGFGKTAGVTIAWLWKSGRRGYFRALCFLAMPTNGDKE